MSKVCLNCGNFIENDDVKYCPDCGNLIGKEIIQEKKEMSSGFLTGAFIFMIISVGIRVLLTIRILLVIFIIGNVNFQTYNQINGWIFYLLSFIPLISLAWKIPILYNISIRRKGGEKLSIAFKIITLVFGNIISGILLLCDSNV